MTCRLLRVVPLRSSTFCEYCRPRRHWRYLELKRKSFDLCWLSAQAQKDGFNEKWCLGALWAEVWIFLDGYFFPAGWDIHFHNTFVLSPWSILYEHIGQFSGDDHVIVLLDIAGYCWGIPNFWTSLWTENCVMQEPGLQVPNSHCPGVWSCWRRVARREHVDACSSFGPETLRAVLSVAMLWSDCGVWAST